MVPKWQLEMSMIGPYGERYTVAVELGRHTAEEVHRLPPPIPGLVSFDDAVQVLKRREFRKDLFTDTATRLGTMLAERLEDKEGWHGVERQENLEDWGPDFRVGGGTPVLSLRK